MDVGGYTAQDNIDFITCAFYYNITADGRWPLQIVNVSYIMGGLVRGACGIVDHKPIILHYPGR